MVNGGLNVVVFGCDGMLGKDLLEMYSYSDGIHVRGYNKSECNIANYDDVWNCLGGTKGSITHVINCSGFTNVDLCETKQKMAYKVNCDGVKILADVCLENEIHLTHISTNYVFEGLDNKPYIEQNEKYPLSVYGKSKLAGEGHVLALGNKGLVIRTAWLYGKNGKNFIDTVINKLELGVDVNVVDDQISTPTYCMDLANVIIQLSTSYKSGPFHVTNSGSCTWYEFAVYAAKLLDLKEEHIKKIKTVDLARKAERPKYSVLSMKRLNETLSEPLRNWKDALYQYLLETKKIYEY